MPRRSIGFAIAALAALLLAGPLARAVITRLTPLKEVIAGQDLIFMAKVQKVDGGERPTAVLTVDATLKGTVPFQRLPVNLTGDTEAIKDKHPEQLLKRLAPDLPLVVFASQRGKRYTAFVYTNGTWFQMVGRIDDDGKTIRWALTHGEPYLRRTFTGTTVELKQVILDALAKKKLPPEPRADEKPGFGPEVTR